MKNIIAATGRSILRFTFGFDKIGPNWAVPIDKGSHIGTDDKSDPVISFKLAANGSQNARDAGKPRTEGATTVMRVIGSL